MKRTFQVVLTGSSYNKAYLHSDDEKMKLKRLQALVLTTILSLSGLIYIASASALTLNSDSDLYEWGEEVEFYGTTEPNTTVSVLIVANSTDETAVNSTLLADGDGEYAFNLTLPEGTNNETFYITVISNNSEATFTFIVLAEEDIVFTEEEGIFTEEESDTEELGVSNGKMKGRHKEKKLKAAFNGLNKGKGARNLYLYEKDPETWNIKNRGAWGKITFLPHKEKYIFNAHKLQPETAYSLINYAPSTDWSEIPYPNPWPGTDSLEIGSSTVNKGGNVHMKGTWEDDFGGKIWLVLSSDFSVGSGMTAWNPTSYLFEYDLLPDSEG